MRKTITKKIGLLILLSSIFPKLIIEFVKVDFNINPNKRFVLSNVGQLLSK